MIEREAALAGKVVAYFFSAEWCPACKTFLPTLSTLYETAKEDEKPFEVVYVSSDRDAEQMTRYFGKHGDWLAIPYEDEKTRSDLKKRYGCFAGAESSHFPGIKRRAGIPSMVVVNALGEEKVHMDCDPPTEINRKGDGVLDEWLEFKW